MKTNKWILGGLMAMAITACTSDELVENNLSTESGKGQLVSVTAYTPGNGNSSRVAPTDIPNERVVSLTWEANDSFTVIQGNANTNFTNGDGGGNTFTGDLPDDTSTDDDNFYAVYPARSVSEASESSASVTVPFDLSTQTGALDESKTYMRAESENGLSYSFKHCTAILKATFTNILPGAKISKVVVTSHTDSKVDGNLDLTTGTISGGSNNTITINYTTAVDASKPVYIYLPPMDADKKELAFVVSTTDGNTYTGTLGASTPQPIEGQDIEAGKLYKASVKLYADGLSFNDETKTFHITKPFGLQLLNKWMTSKITTNVFKGYIFEGNTSDNISQYNRLKLNVSIDADVVLPMTDIDTGDPITITDGVPSGSNWIPIGNSIANGSLYEGTFNGNNHKITNLSVKKNSDYTGLIGSLSESGTVLNITLESANLSGKKFVGGILGYNFGGTVESCIVNGNISGNSHVGGIVGENENGTLENCTNRAQVIGKENVGGIAGKNGFSIKGSTNNGTVKVPANPDVNFSNEVHIGGIVGWLYNSRSTVGLVEGCINNSAVTGSNYHNVGGIIGYLENGYCYASANKANVYGGHYAGGIIGKADVRNIYGCWTSKGTDSDGFGNLYDNIDGLGCYYGTMAEIMNNYVEAMNTVLSSRSVWRWKAGSPSYTFWPSLIVVTESSAGLNNFGDGGNLTPSEN